MHGAVAEVGHKKSQHPAPAELRQPPPPTTILKAPPPIAIEKRRSLPCLSQLISIVLNFQKVAEMRVVKELLGSSQEREHYTL